MRPAARARPPPPQPRRRAAAPARRGAARGGAPAPAAAALAVVDRELERAALALCDLDAAREGRRAGDLPGVVDARSLAGEVHGAWLPVAQTAGRELRLETTGD